MRGAAKIVAAPTHAMLTITARNTCTVCRRLPAQGTVDDAPRCLSCGLVGEERAGLTPHTEGLVVALASPTIRRADSLRDARDALAAELGRVGASVDEYNRFSDALLREVGSPLVAFDPWAHRVQASGVALHAAQNYVEWTRGDRFRETTQAIADALVAPLAAALDGNERHARKLVSVVLGPFDASQPFVVVAAPTIAAEAAALLDSASAPIDAAAIDALRVDAGILDRVRRARTGYSRDRIADEMAALYLSAVCAQLRQPGDDNELARRLFNENLDRLYAALVERTELAQLSQVDGFGTWGTFVSVAEQAVLTAPGERVAMLKQRRSGVRRLLPDRRATDANLLRECAVARDPRPAELATELYAMYTAYMAVHRSRKFRPVAEANATFAADWREVRARLERRFGVEMARLVLECVLFTINPRMRVSAYEAADPAFP